MKSIVIFCLLFFHTQFNLFAQADGSSKYNIGFNKNDKGDTLRRSKTNESLGTIEVLASNNKADAVKDNIIQVEIDKSNSTLPSDQYEVITNINGRKLSELASSNPVRVVIKKENDAFRQIKALILVLKIKVKTTNDGKLVDDDDANNEGKYTEITITVVPSDEVPLKTYKYLGYLGTNFDLIDGVQAKNLFFATNIFIPETKSWGFNMGLYGNRTLTTTDSSQQTTFLSRIDKISNDSILLTYDRAKKMTNRVSDNIGAYFLPLIPLKPLNEGTLKLYYAPQFEFIWRRTTIENLYSDNQTIETQRIKRTLPTSQVFPLITPLSSKVNFNVYDAYIGLLGLLIRYETEDISIRLNSSVGLNINYVPVGALSQSTTSNRPSPVYPVYDKQYRYFFYGRLWITEPSTGLTLGAEISNYFGNRESAPGVKVSNAQPYYNVTLSKAFDLKNFATVVKPLSNR